MKKFFVLTLIVLCGIISAQPKYTEIASKVGGFSRMGFGARGMGMGNAMSAVTSGNLSVYYNPALSVFQEGNVFQTSYSILSLDRNLNFLSFTKKFSLKSKSSFQRTMGFSAGLINAGVNDINEYDGEGNQVGTTSTSENMFYFAIANRFSEKLVIGATFKYYYYKLYTDLSSTSFGVDIGALYLLNDNFTISFGLADINSKYEWDTGDLYGTSGKNTTDKFPMLKRIGVAFKSDDKKLLVAFDFENSNAGTNYLRMGAEYNIYESFYLRGGLDHFNLSNFDEPVRPSLGFSYFYKLEKFIVGVDYAFVIEPYSPSDQHILGVNFKF